MEQTPDIDYLFLSTRVKAMERSLLTKEQIKQILEAPTAQDAVRVLAEYAYPGISPELSADPDEILRQEREKLLADFSRYPAARSITDIFMLRCDYHNAKVLVKSEALGTDQAQILIHGGRYDPQRLAEDYGRETLFAYSSLFRRAVSQARAILASTGDPQQAEFLLDRAYFDEMSSLARASGNQFLKNYAALCIDTANLRCVVRALRLNKNSSFLEQILVPGGTVNTHALSVACGNNLVSLFHSSELAAAAAEGSTKVTPNSGPLTEFERLCDDAITQFFCSRRHVPFGAEPILGYLHARETEAIIIRIILTGRMAGLDTETIRERLRKSYV